MFFLYDFVGKKSKFEYNQEKFIIQSEMWVIRFLFLVIFKVSVF